MAAQPRRGSRPRAPARGLAASARAAAALALLLVAASAACAAVAAAGAAPAAAAAHAPAPAAARSAEPAGSCAAGGSAGGAASCPACEGDANACASPPPPEADASASQQPRQAAPRLTSEPVSDEWILRFSEYKPAAAHRCAHPRHTHITHAHAQTLSLARTTHAHTLSLSCARTRPRSTTPLTPHAPRHRSVPPARRAALEVVWGAPGSSASPVASWEWVERDNPAAAFPTDFALVRPSRGKKAVRHGCVCARVCA
jgi:hypothetical protein